MAFCRCVCNGEKYRYYLHYKWHFAAVFVMVKSADITYTTNDLSEVNVFVMVKSAAITYTTNGLSEIDKEILWFCLLVLGYCLKLNKTNRYTVIKTIVINNNP